jgi:hypothetical protein
MPTIRYQKPSRIPLILHSLLLLLIAASVLTYWQIAEYALNGNWLIEYYKLTSYTNQVPVWTKTAKDVFALLLLFGSLIYRPSNPHPILKNNKDLALSYTVCSISLGIAFIRSLFTSLPDFLIFSSLRPFIIVLAIFIFCHRHLQPYYLRWVLESTNLFVIIQVYYAVKQRNSAIINNGVNWLHSGSARSVGTFIEPNAMGLFLALMFYINLSILPPHRLRPLLLGSIAVGIFFTGSRASQLSSVITLSLVLYSKFEASKNSTAAYFFKTFLAIPLLLIVVFWLYEQVNLASGRVSSASGGRLEILSGEELASVDVLSLFFGKYLSFGSNLIQTLSNANSTSSTIASREYFLADSTPAWLLGQFGLFGILGVLGVVYSLWRIRPRPSTITAKKTAAASNRLRTNQTGLLIYLFFSTFTIILFEFYAALPLLIPLLFLGRTIQPEI